MAQTCLLRYATPLFLATALVCAASAPVRASVETDVPAEVSTTDASLGAAAPADVSGSLPAALEASAMSENAAQEFQKINQMLADEEADDLRKRLPCADWATVALTSRRKQSSNRLSFLPDPDFKYLKTSQAGGVTLFLYQETGYPMASAACANITAANHDKVTCGAETVYIDAGHTDATLMISFWRVSKTGLQISEEKAESALTAAAHKCTALGLPLNDLTDWPSCLGGQLIGSPDQDIRDATFNFVAVVADKLAGTIAKNVTDGFGLVEKTLSLTSGSMTRDITFFGVHL